MGLSVLPYMDEIFKERKKVVEMYDALLDFSKLQRLKIRENTNWNYSYYPVIFESEEKLLLAQKTLNEIGIFPRRYFNPSLNTLLYVEYQRMPISESVSNRVLCLPLYAGLKEKDVEQITALMR